MIKRVTLLFFLIVFSSGFLFAGKIEKGFEALRVYNYFSAREIFTKTSAKHPAASGYGLATIYSRTDNPFFNVSRAHAAILVCTWGLHVASEKEKQLLKKLGVSNDTIFYLKKYIDTLAYRIADKKGTIAAWEEYLDVYCGSVLYDRAVTIRNVLAFREVQLEGTWQGYKKFADAYPDAIQHQAAVSMYERLLYEYETSAGTIEANERFLVNYPENPFCAQAQDAILNLSVPNHNIIEYREFIRKYPQNRNVPEAWRKIYALYTADGRSTTIAQFWIAYPDFPFKETISEDLRLSMNVFYPIKQNEKWGFCDSTGTTSILCTYDWVESFSEGIASAGRKDKSGFIGKNGKVAIPFDFDEVESFNRGSALVKKDGKVGIIDRAGHLVVPIVYDEISEFHDARAVVVRSGKYGYIDKFGGEVVPCQYEKTGDFSGGVAYVVDSSKYGFIDHSGNLIIKCEYEWVETFDQGCARVEKDGKYGLLGMNGKLLLPCDYTFISPFSEGFAMVVLDEQCGYVRRNGTFIIPCFYQYDKNLAGESSFHHGMVRIKNHDKCGMMDSTGKTVVPFEFDDILPFENGAAPVLKKGKWGYIDSKIRLVIPYNYESAGTFKDGLARVKVNGKTGIINRNEKVIVEPQFESINYLDQFIAVDDGNGWGLLDKSGNWILPCKYSKIDVLNGSTVRVEVNNKFGYFNVISCEFIWREEGVE